MEENNTQYQEANEDLSLAGIGNLGEEKLVEDAVDRAVRIIANVQKFKQPRIERITKYRELYANNVKPKYRQPFNVVLPVFAGAMDTLMAEFNDDLSVDMGEGDPADYLKVKKFNALWDKESTSQEMWAKFPYKARTDRSNALFSGRGFMMNYAVSEPKYSNHFEIYELEDAIFQPGGGGLMEMHLYKGRTNLVRSRSELEKGPYNQTWVKKLLANCAKTDFDPLPNDEDAQNFLTKFKAAGLDVQSADYVGEHLFRLVEMVLRINGVDYYLVFSPWYKQAVRFDTLSNMTSAGRSPFVSWATHEDNRNFLTKSYADDMYGVASATHTLFNQELTNREKANFGVKGYDPEMITNVAQMDKAFTRPDGLFSVRVPAGKTIKDGLFEFKTSQLTGTINLIEWMNEVTGREMGITDLSKGGVQNVSKKASVVFQEQQNLTKRLVLRSSSYTEAMGEICQLFIAGCIDHLPAKMAVRMLGVEGEGWDQIARADGDLDLVSKVDVVVRSSTIEMQNSQLKKDARMKVLNEISADPVQMSKVNPSWVVEEKLRSGAELDDSAIAVAMDTRNTGNRREVARAHQAISELRNGKKPEIYYAATDLFLEIIRDFALEWRGELGNKKFMKFMEYITEHGDIAMENTKRKGQQDARQTMAPNADQADPNKAPVLTPSVPLQVDEPQV